MKKRCEQLSRILLRDGLFYRPFVLIGYVFIWGYPSGEYSRVLGAYAAYTGGVPELIHAELCRRLLVVGKEIGPEAYLRRVEKEVEIENRIPVE